MIVSGRCHCCSSLALHLCSACGRWVCRECFDLSEGHCGPCLMQAPPSLAYSFSGLHILMPGRRHVRHDPRREPHSHEKVVDTAGGGQADGKDVGGAGGDVKSGAVEDPVEKGERGPRAPHKRAGRVKEPGSCEANPDR